MARVVSAGLFRRMAVCGLSDPKAASVIAPAKISRPSLMLATGITFSVHPSAL
jgi:hypothetical protein